ncbi:alpha-ribazole phosphatase [uncultured Clostridium sp.]|uniref:alpha-ribazole phosphatase n=1 Tax=uncultured Clostridium sp. TaxID=59620 RepID=UPI0028E2C8FC|nr:alpha-ribazole phosphatase [uncultured Clostridium sp.]
MNIYLVRHGETDNNYNKTYYGKIDCSLNENGRHQSSIIKSRIEKINFDKIFTSEMKRAKETAHIILENSKYELIEDGRLNEMDMGIFEGKDHKELEENYSVEWKNWCNNWKEYKIPNGESYIEFYDRVKDFFEEILRGEEKDILVVAHGGVMKSIYSYILGENLDIFWKISSRNGDMTLIKYEYGNIYIDSIIPVEI